MLTKKIGKSYLTKEPYRKTRGLSEIPLFCGSNKFFKYAIILRFLRSFLISVY